MKIYFYVAYHLEVVRHHYSVTKTINFSKIIEPPFLFYFNQESTH